MKTYQELQAEADSVEETIKVANDWLQTIHKAIADLPVTIKVTLELTPDELKWLNMVQKYGGEISKLLCGMPPEMGTQTEYTSKDFDKWYNAQYKFYKRGPFSADVISKV